MDEVFQCRSVATITIKIQYCYVSSLVLGLVIILVTDRKDGTFSLPYFLQDVEC